MPMLLTKLMAAGLGSGLANAFCADTADSQTATGTNQATAFETSTAFVRFTTVASGTGCLLDNGARGDSQFIINAGANALLVYPHVGGSINGLGTNAAFSIPAGSWAAFDRYTDTLWTASNDAASSSFVQSGTTSLSDALQRRDRQIWYATESMTAAQRADVTGGTGAIDVTTALQNVESDRPAGSTLVWPAGTYKITGDITASKAGAWLMQGITINSAAGRLIYATSDFAIEGGRSTLNFTEGGTSDLRRAVRASGGLSAEYGTTGTIAVGATSFVADTLSEAQTVAVGDWVIVINHDVSNWIQVEFKQVLSQVGTTINVTTPFAQAFDGTYTIEWVLITSLRQNLALRDLTIITTGAVNDNIGFDGQPGVIDMEVSGCVFDIGTGLAWQNYGHMNPKVFNNVIRRQVGRRSAISSCHGGSVHHNKFVAKGALATNGALTVETGTFGTHFHHNEIYGGTGGSGIIYHNNSNHCEYEGNLIVGDGTVIGIYCNGSSNNTFRGNRYLNVLDGVRFARDTAPTPDLDSNNNTVIDDAVRNATNGVNIAANATNTAVIGLDVDTTVTTPVNDAGTKTAYFRKDANTSGFAMTRLFGAAGTAASPTYSSAADTATGWYIPGANAWHFTAASADRMRFTGNIILAAAGTYAWSQSSTVTDTLDLIMVRDAANTLALKNANLAQEMRVYAGNGGFISQVKSVTEALTIAAAATTVSATTIPAGAILLAVSVRVTTVIPTAATFTVTTTSGGTTLNTAAVSTAANSTDAGTAAGASYRSVSTTVTITPNLTPGAATGVVRLQFYYLQVTPATS